MRCTTAGVTSSLAAGRYSVPLLVRLRGRGETQELTKVSILIVQLTESLGVELSALVLSTSSFIHYSSHVIYLVSTRPHLL